LFASSGLGLLYNSTAENEGYILRPLGRSTVQKKKTTPCSVELKNILIAAFFFFLKWGYPGLMHTVCFKISRATACKWVNPYAAVALPVVRKITRGSSE
jgi:hypothetical protein